MGDAAIADAVIAWHRAHARGLPWRDAPAGERDPYRVLVSEVMLQQTQVARVIEKFDAFLERFPSVDDLARATEESVLAEWSGLGYYRRARLLHRAARAIVDEHGGVIPRDHAALLSIPGIGRYTAGAVASIAFGDAAPIVDGNVARVILRLEGREERPDDRAGAKRTWARAETLVSASDSAGEFNEGLMELGATVCTPRNPRCMFCPISEHCDAFATGRQDAIPMPKAGIARTPLFMVSVLAIDARGRRLVERRPENGLWGGMHQAPSVERADRFATENEIRETVGVETGPTLVEFEHQTTHRDVRFRVMLGENARAGNGRSWASRKTIAGLPLGNPQRRILLEIDPETRLEHAGDSTPGRTR
jgi:A/G-specific adenine glycosylase